MNSVLEHAARVLDHQPTRSMAAETLYRRTIRESGCDMPFPRFMDAVRERSDHFAVIPPDPVIGAADAWDARQRSLYEAALEAAGMMQPLIVLAERLTDGAGAHEIRAPATFDVFRDAHDSLTHLLHASDPEDTLYSAVKAAMEELHAARRMLES